MKKVPFGESFKLYFSEEDFGMDSFVSFMESPVGWLGISASEKGITEVHILAEGERPGDPNPSPAVEVCIDQLDEYFKGQRQVFEVSLDLRGTPFQLAVWKELLRIPFGHTRSYGQVARNVGREKAFRAVGGANHNNPVAIIVPCHRVIGKDGSLVGYGGGLDKKAWFLAHEKRTLVEKGRRSGPDGVK